MDNVKVKCYSGYTYAERPMSFTLQNMDYKIKAIEKEWLTPGERHFLIHTGDNKLRQLCYNEINDEWLITGPVGD